MRASRYNKQIDMYLTHTSKETHDILSTGFDRSPMFTGRIKGSGPRYCPSIEDKDRPICGQRRAPDLSRARGIYHECRLRERFLHIAAAEIQERGLRTIPGLCNVRMIRPGYAVEYDYFPPSQLKTDLRDEGRRRAVPGRADLRDVGLRGGGRTGADGRHQRSAPRQGREKFVLKRSEGYIGVLVDDLVNKSTDEPYRMFTSRAEYRLSPEAGQRRPEADEVRPRPGPDPGVRVRTATSSRRN